MLSSLGDITEYRRGNIRPSCLEKIMNILRMVKKEEDPKFLYPEWYRKYCSWKEAF